MKKLTEEEMVILKNFATEFKLLIINEQDYEGATIKEQIDDYVAAKCDPMDTIKERTIYQCKTSADGIAFLMECYRNGVFFLTDACIVLPINEAIDAIERSNEGLEFLLAPTGDRVLMGVDLKKGRESLPVIEFTATKGVQ